MPVGAAIGAGIAGAGASIIGSKMQSDATKDASKVQREMFDQTRSDLAPYRDAGAQGTNMLLEKIGGLTAPIQLSQEFLESTPGYQFTKTQGLKAVQSGAAARGLGKSGAAIKGATNFATGLADQTFGEQFARELQQRDSAYNKLMGLSNVGSNAAAQTGQFATQTGQQIGQNTISGATAAAAGLTGAANSLGNAANTVGGINYANQLLKQGYAPAGFYRTQ